jgi:hypothetical protein
MRKQRYALHSVLKGMSARQRGQAPNPDAPDNLKLVIYRDKERAAIVFESMSGAKTCGVESVKFNPVNCD